MSTADLGHPLKDSRILAAKTESELGSALNAWYKMEGSIAALPEKEHKNKCLVTRTSHNPTLPQAFAHRLFQLPTASSRRGLLCWHSLGSGKTATACGIMASFWNSEKQIVYASSIGGIASNPPSNFEGVSSMFPDFKWSDRRDFGLVFLSFARLANKIEKGEKLMKLLKSKSGGGSEEEEVQDPPTPPTSPAMPEAPIQTQSAPNPGQKPRAPDPALTKSAPTPALVQEELSTPPTSPAMPEAPIQTKSAPNPRQKPSKANPVVAKSAPSLFSKIMSAFTPQKAQPSPTPAPSPIPVPSKFSFFEVLAKRYNVSLAKATASAKVCQIKSFNDFVDLDHTVLIVDEVHNLFRPLSTQKQKHKIVEKRLTQPMLYPKLKIVILTATPGSSTTEVITLLNMVSPTGQVGPAPTADSQEEVMQFKEKIQNLVSYYDLTNDKGLFPTVSDPGPLKWPMSMAQFQKYADAYKEVTKGHKDYDQLAAHDALPKFWSKARKYANMMYNFDMSLQLSEFSSKLPALLQTIHDFPNEKHYVYSAFYDKRGSGQGILEIARQLEDRGYVKYGKGAHKSGETQKKYVLAIQGQPGLDAAIRAFNNTSNVDGSDIHVFLATQDFNEGLDLKAVRHVHIFEPLVTMASDQQTIGRARRFCSHKDLSHKEWTVKIHRYFAEMPIEVSSEGGIEGKLNHLKSLNTENMTKAQIANLKKEIRTFEKFKNMELKSIDQFIYEESQRRMRDLFTVYRCMQEASLDCAALAEFHGFVKQTDFKCM